MTHACLICHYFYTFSRHKSDNFTQLQLQISSNGPESLYKSVGGCVCGGGVGGVCVRIRGVHIHRQCGGTVLSPDLFFLADEKENCANMINGHDYLLRKCGFLAQQLYFYDLNLGQYVLSCRLSCRHTPQKVCGDDQHIVDREFTIIFLGKRGKASRGLQPRCLSFNINIGLRSLRLTLNFNLALCLWVYMRTKQTNSIADCAEQGYTLRSK